MTERKHGLKIHGDIKSSEVCKITISGLLEEAFQLADSVASGEFLLVGSSARKCVREEPEGFNDIDFIGSFDLDYIQNRFKGRVIRRWEKFRTIKIQHVDKEIDFIADLDVEQAMEEGDVTISHLCIDKNGVVYDPTNCLDDVVNGVVRIRDAENKIQASPDRILRVLRFAAVLGYEVDIFTRQACTKYAHLMNLDNSEYALVKLMNKDERSRKNALDLAKDFGISNFIDDLITQKVHNCSIGFSV